MQPWATSGLAVGATALLLALAGCGMVPPGTSNAGPLPDSMAGAQKMGSDMGSGKAIMSGNTAMMDQAGMTDMMATGTASGSMMSGDMMSQMMGMMDAGSASGDMMSSGTMSCMMDTTSTHMASGGVTAGSGTMQDGGASGTADGAATAGGETPSGETHSEHHP